MCRRMSVTYPFSICSPCIVLIIFMQFGGFVPLTTLKHHFNVSNSYVVYKLRLILFPWRHKPWTRRIRRADQGYSQNQGGSPGVQGAQSGGEWMPPREDVNSPDLYIPCTQQPHLLSPPLIRVATSNGLSNLYPPFRSPLRPLSSMDPQYLRC